MGARSTIIPDFLRARSPQGLRKLMFLTNTKFGKQFSYFSIQFVEKDKSWYAWFFRDLNDNFSGQVEMLLEEDVK